MKQPRATTAQTQMFDGLMSELRKVSWPTRQETVRLTMVVVLISLIIGLYVGIIDVFLARLLELLSKSR